MTQIDLAKQALAAYHATTIKRSDYEARLAAGKYDPPDGSGTFWGKGDAALAQIIGTQPPASKGGTVAIYQLGGSLAGCSHLDDGTYSDVIGDWDAVDLLAKVSGNGYAYTVTYDPVNASFFTQLHADNPQPFIDVVLPYLSLHNCKGIFLDNADLTIPGINAALMQVSAALHAEGKLLAANLGAFIGGNPDSDDGILERSWLLAASQCGVDLGMVENWMQFSGGPQLGQNRLDGNGGQPEAWQHVPSQYGKMRVIYATYGVPANAVFGRAAMLTSPACPPDAVFGYNSGSGSHGGGDPYDPVWTKTNPNPAVDFQTGAASL